MKGPRNPYTPKPLRYEPAMRDPRLGKEPTWIEADKDPRDGIEPDWIRRDDPGVIEKLWNLDIPPRWVWAFVVLAALLWAAAEGII